MVTALYRRYRPETFAELIGQSQVTDPLRTALRNDRVNHAYLFSGPRGCGKTTSARILARCLNCVEGPTDTPCGVCPSCVELSRDGGGSMDVVEIDAASHNGVDDARDIRDRAVFAPARDRYKIFILDEAHMVTPQGFNALLKIVEEPPEHVKFIFATTEPEKVIGTIRSRTHHYPFRLVPPLQLTDYMQRLCTLENVAVEPGVLGFVTRAGGGSVRDSLSVLDQLIAGSSEVGLTYAGAASLLGFTDGELLDATIDAFAARDGAAVFAQIDKVIESGHDPRRFVEDLLERLRDLIIVAAVPDGAASVLRGVPEDQLDRMRGQQSRFGPGALSRAADIVNTGLTEMTGATAPRLQLELICARILLPAASGEQGYAARLDRLERRLDLAGTPSPALPSAPPSRPSEPRPSEPRASEPRASDPRVSEDRGAEQHHDAPASPAGSSPDRGHEHEPAHTPTAAAGPRETSLHVEAAAPRPNGSGDPADGSVPQTPAADSPAPASPPPAGVIDAAAIRRVWPDVLARVFRTSRVTWTFVSQHAQVLEYDGKKLVLGIGTVGLANTFRNGNHAEVVKQALIDEIGVDVPVEGIPTPDFVPPADTAQPSDDPRSSSPSGPGAAPPPFEAASVPTRRGASARADAGPTDAGLTATAAATRVSEPSGSGADWSSTSAPAPDWATSAPASTAAPIHASASASAPVAPVAHVAHVAPVAQPAKGAAAQAKSVRDELVRVRRQSADSGAQRRPSVEQPQERAVDDSQVSVDDEDIVETGTVGREVIERVLGGKFLGEFED